MEVLIYQPKCIVHLLQNSSIWRCSDVTINRLKLLEPLDAETLVVKPVEVFVVLNHLLAGFVRLPEKVC